MGSPLGFFIGPGIPDILAQKDARLLAALLPGFTFPVTGAFKLLPVARLYFARPFAVRPPVLDFSPLPTLKFTCLRFFLICPPLLVPFYELG